VRILVGGLVGVAHAQLHCPQPLLAHSWAAAAVCVSGLYADAGAGVPVVRSQVLERNCQPPDAELLGFSAWKLPPDSHSSTRQAVRSCSAGKWRATSSAWPPQLPELAGCTCAGGGGGAVVGGGGAVVVVVGGGRVVGGGGGLVLVVVVGWRSAWGGPSAAACHASWVLGGCSASSPPAEVHAPSSSPSVATRDRYLVIRKG
jgi:hypothetical protein